MKRYVTFLFIISIIFILIGLISGKISGSSFGYISLTGSLFAIIQIVYIVAIMMLGIVVILPALIIDLLLMFIGMAFPLSGYVWDLVWNKVTIGWFWVNTSGSSILFASLILAIISGLMLRKKR